MITRYLIFLLKGPDDLKYQQKFLKVFRMACRNFCKDLLVLMYYPNHEEKFFNQGISGLYVLQFQGKAS